MHLTNLDQTLIIYDKITVRKDESIIYRNTLITINYFQNINSYKWNLIYQVA
jgi:hypothetical protein